MADPITIVGTVASAVQLADAVARVSRELYSFFRDVKDAFRDAEHLQLSLQSMEAIAASVHVHASDIHHGTLPEVVSALKNCRDELDSLNAIVKDTKSGQASQSSVRRLGKRVSWVFDERKIQASMKRLETLKSNLSLALLIDIHMRSCRHHDIKVQNDISNKLSGLESQFSRFSVLARSFTAECNIQASDEDKFARILRNQLNVVLPEVMEDYLSQSRQEFKGWLRKEFQNVPAALENIFTSFSQHHEAINSQIPSLSDVTKFSEAFVDKRHHVSESSCYNDQPFFVRTSFTTTQGSHTVWRTWTFKWMFGRLHVLIGTAKSTQNGEFNRARAYKTKIELMPAAWIFPRGAVFSYTIHTDQRGYPTICPMLSTFAIVPSSAEQFYLVREGNIDELHRMFDIGLAAPTDRSDCNGWSLLHDAVYNGDLAMTRYLISQGADVLACDDSGQTPIDLLHNYAFSYVLEPESDDGGDAINSNIECATQIFRLLKASGVDRADDQLRWSRLLIYAQSWIFTSVRMASVIKIREFFNTIGIDIDEFDNSGYNLLTAIAGSETVPSTFYGSIPWDVYHLKTFLEFGVDPNTRTASGQNSLHCVVNAYAFDLFRLYLENGEDLLNDKTFQGDRHRYYKRQFGKCRRDVIQDAFFEKVKMLIEAGCDLHARDVNDETPSALVQRYFSDREHCRSIMQTWAEALRRCGLDINDVLAADKRDLAMTTAVDFEPTINGHLHHRNVHRSSYKVHMSGG